MRLFLAPLLAALALVLPGPAPAAAVTERGEALSEALSASRSGDWTRAAAAVAGIDSPAAGDIVEWIKLRAGAGFWVDYRAFLARNGDWPGLPYLRRKGEPQIPADADPGDVVAYFRDSPPDTGAGIVRLAGAYSALGRVGDAGAEVVRAWRELELNEGDEKLLLAAFPDILAPHHEARLDMLLWQGAEDAARRMFPHVGADWRKLAEARIALRALAPGVDARIAAVPEPLAGDPGLAYERFLWRLRKGRDDDARALLRARSESAAALGRPGAWSNRRRSFARAAMRAGEAALAYELAARHHLVEGSDYADLEWLAGYIALTKRDDPETALEHFQRFDAYVETPISRGRAGYWLGRAHAALGQEAAAAAAYAAGAEHQTSFYGQLAAEAAGLPPDPALAGTGAVPDWRAAGFATSSVLAAALLLHEAGDRNLSERFFVHLAESLDPQELAQLGELALDIGRPHIALMISKQAARQGVTIPKSYYPLTALAQMEVPVAVEVALAIARRESEFDPLVISPVGARGLMQLMPATAEAMAGKTGLDYAPERLTLDWKYNATLGAAYLAELVETFDGSMVLVSAAYNAGPSRVYDWIERFGDPRSAGTDPVDWIEHIPFRETRNYVMRVMESLLVYRARLRGAPPPHSLSAELEGRN